MEKILTKPKLPVFFFLLILTISTITASNIASAGDNLSIKGQLRTDIINSMEEYIAKQTIDGKLFVFDAVQNKLLELKSGKLRKRIAKDGGFYVTCADYTDQNGRNVDLDLLVKKSGNKYITTQTIVHAVDGKYRPYHVSDRNN